MAPRQAKSALLGAAVEHALEAGIGDLSLRQIAAAIGTSHRMLLYHFGSREGLLAAVTEAVESAERRNVFASKLTAASAREFWDRVSDPSLRAQERLFFEIYSQALLNRPGTEGFLDNVVDGWTQPMVASLVETGFDADLAATHARLALAVVRGLLLDLVATDDDAGTREAFDLYLRAVAAPLTRRPRRARR
jgi:AcrR family transcriptional regulator